MHIYDPYEHEHSEILSIMSKLTPGVPISVPELNRLVSHISDHFSKEDELMQEAAYPGRWKHEEDHELIQSLFVTYLPQLASGTGSSEQLDLMIERLKLHIDTEDVDMLQFICTYKPEVMRGR